MRMRVLAAVLLLLSAPAGASAFDVFVNPNHTCSPATIGGKPEHATLQLAENAALPGDAIGVCPGAYHEVVIIPKETSFTAIGHVIIAPIGGGVCFDITGDGVRVRGFEIRACDIAIRIVASDALIANNKIHHNGTGLEITGTDTVVQNNLVTNNGDGVVVTGISDGTDIKNNTLRHNASKGIVLAGANGVTVNKNSVQYSYDVGIDVSESSDCTVSFNSVAFNGTGIRVRNSTRCLITRNVVTRSKGKDCDWDGAGSIVFAGNVCRNETPIGPVGAWD